MAVKCKATVDLTAMGYNLNVVQKHKRSLKICYRNPQNMLTNLVQLFISNYIDKYSPGQCHKIVKCFLQH